MGLNKSNRRGGWVVKNIADVVFVANAGQAYSNMAGFMVSKTKSAF